jgi:hypothetical protein
MDERESPSPIRLLYELGRTLFFGVVAVIVYVLYSAQAEPFDILKSAILGVAVVSPIIGAYFVWSVVRYANRHVDSRHAKRPPDPP